MVHHTTYDIETYILPDDWAQGKYLVHGYLDVLWTDDLDQAMAFLKDSVEKGDNLT